MSVQDTGQDRGFIPKVKIGRKNKTESRSIAFKWFVAVSKEIESQTGRKAYAPKLEDQYRLLTWRIWVNKYKVSLQFIVKTLVPYWQKRFSRYQHGIGVKIATLTGNVSEQMLISAISKEFPDQENIQAWKSEQQWNRLRFGIKPIEGEDFFERYVQAMQARQAIITRKVTDIQFKKRKYRNNPFI